MNRRQLLSVLLSAGLPLFSFGQQRVRRIGFSSGSTAPRTEAFLAAFHAGMAELGWTEGRDYTLEARHAEGSTAKQRTQAAELIALRPDLFLATGDDTVRELALRTRTIPIVFTLGQDPVGAGFAASLKRPGGNVTGVTTLVGELAAKRLEILKEAFPHIAHVGLLYEPNLPIGPPQVKAVEEAAKRFGIRTTRLELRTRDDIEGAFKRGAAARVQAYMPMQGILMASQRLLVAEHIARSRLPAIYISDVFALETGGLMSYGPSATDAYRRAAGYVDKIFKGANPGELPIEQPTKVDLVISLKAAKAMGFTISPSVLLRADRVIE